MFCVGDCYPGSRRVRTEAEGGSGFGRESGFGQLGPIRATAKGERAGRVDEDCY